MRVGKITKQEFSSGLKAELEGKAALGETSVTAYRGDRGKTAYDHSQTTHLSLGSTSTTAHRGDHGLVAYNHSQASHAPSDAPSNTVFTNALDLKANLSSPTFSGSPTAPTQSLTDSSTKLATTAFTRGQRVTGNLSITTSSWVASGNEKFPFKKSIAITGVTSSDYPISFAFTLATLEIAETANAAYVECYNGGIAIFAESVPSATMSADYVIIKN